MAISLIWPIQWGLPLGGMGVGQTLTDCGSSGLGRVGARPRILEDMLGGGGLGMGLLAQLLQQLRQALALQQLLGVLPLHDLEMLLQMLPALDMTKPRGSGD